MKKYICDVCGYVYDPATGDPENGINPGTAFEDIPEDWVCPLCAVGKDEFSEEQIQVLIRALDLDLDYKRSGCVSLYWYIRFIIYLIIPNRQTSLGRIL